MIYGQPFIVWCSAVMSCNGTPVTWSIKVKSINELQNALEKAKTLSGLLPICANCKKTRNDEGAWNQMEFHIQNPFQ